MISQVDLEFSELEAMHKKFRNSLRMANELFPENPKIKEAEEKFAKICQLSSAPQTIGQRY